MSRPARSFAKYPFSPTSALTISTVDVMSTT
jgi:hypothetical protein